MHDAGVVHNDVNLTEGLERFFEQLFYVVGVCNVSLDSDSTSARTDDLVYGFFGFGRTACEVDDYAESVGSKPKGNRVADSAGSAGDDGSFSP